MLGAALGTTRDDVLTPLLAHGFRGGRSRASPGLTPDAPRARRGQSTVILRDVITFSSTPDRRTRCAAASTATARFPETSYGQTQRRLRVGMGRLACAASTKTFDVARLETPIPGELRDTHAAETALI